MALRFILISCLAVGFCQAQTTQPKRDAFYNMPTPGSLDGYDYGYILDYRNNLKALRNVFFPTAPAIQNAWQIKFVTSDTQGRKVAAVTTLLQPTSSKNGYLASYQSAYDSADIDCSPSYQLGARQYLINNLTQALVVEQQFIGLLLGQGFWVNVPDYEGLTASFGSGLTAAYATLDSIRAALNSNSKFQSGLSSTPTIGMVGYSGGAFATEFAAELQPSHAAGVTSLIAAIVIGGVPVDITGFISKVDGPGGSGFGTNVYLIPNVLQGIASTYSAFARYLYGLSRQTSLDTQRSFNYSLDSCKSSDHFKGQEIFGKYLNTDLATFRSNAVVQNTLAATSILGKHGHPTHPTYIFQGGQDEIVNAQRTTDLVNQYCGSNFSNTPGLVARGNVSIEYVLDLGNGIFASHAGEAILGIGPAFQFLLDQLAKPSPTVLTGCTFRTSQPIASSLLISLLTPGPGFHG